MEDAGGWGGGIAVVITAEMRVATVGPPFAIGARNALGSVGALPELAAGSLWRKGLVKGPARHLPELTVGKTNSYLKSMASS